MLFLLMAQHSQEEGVIILFLLMRKLSLQKVKWVALSHTARKCQWAEAAFKQKSDSRVLSLKHYTIEKGSYFAIEAIVIRVTISNC